MSAEQTPAVILLSGGLDSATALAEARAAGFRAPRPDGELRPAPCRGGRGRAASGQGAGRDPARELAIDLRAFGGSALTSDIEVPKDRPSERMAAEIPITYVPARNTVFLRWPWRGPRPWALFDIFVGVNCVDYSRLSRLSTRISPARSRRWPTWQPARRRGSGTVPDSYAADPAHQGQIIRRDWSSASTTA